MNLPKPLPLRLLNNLRPLNGVKHVQGNLKWKKKTQRLLPCRLIQTRLLQAQRLNRFLRRPQKNPKATHQVERNENHNTSINNNATENHTKHQIIQVRTKEKHQNPLNRKRIYMIWLGLLPRRVCLK